MLTNLIEEQNKLQLLANDFTSPIHQFFNRHSCFTSALAKVTSSDFKIEQSQNAPNDISLNHLLDHSTDVTLHSGQLSTKTTIHIPKGRNGFNPELNLVYSSELVDGVFGLGWHLDIPSIRLQDDFSSHDSESEKIEHSKLGVLGKALNQKETNSNRIAHLNGAKYKVTNYLPLIEKDYSKIEYWLDVHTEESYWKIISRNNITSWYGRDYSSKTVNSKNHKNTLEWFLDEQIDDKGNVIKYQYKRPEITLGDSEKHEVPHLAIIRYGNTVMRTDQNYYRDNQWLFQIKLNYGNENKHSFTSPISWQKRKQPITKHVSSNQLLSSYLCTNLEVYHNFEQLDGIQLTNSYEFTYEDLEDHTLLKRITRVFHDGANSKEYPSLDFQYTPNKPDFSCRSIHLSPSQQQDFSNQHESFKNQIIRNLLPSNQNTSSENNTSNANTPPTNHLGCKISRSTSPTPLINWGDPTLRILDISGSGIPDLIITENYCFNYFSKDNCNTRETTYQESSDWLFQPSSKLIHYDNELAIFLADLTGNGINDLVRVKQDEIAYWPSVGYKKFGEKITFEGFSILKDLHSFNPRNIHLTDMNGSGRQDVIYNNGGEIYYWENIRGKSFQLENIVLAPEDTENSTFSAEDLMLKGTGCFVWQNVDEQNNVTAIQYIDLFDQKPLLLNQVSNNKGGVYRIQYSPISEFQTIDNLASLKWNSSIKVGSQVVSRIEKFDCITDTRTVNEFAYHDPSYYYDNNWRWSFGLVETWDAESSDSFESTGLFPLGVNEQLESNNAPVAKTKYWFGVSRKSTVHFPYYTKDQNSWDIKKLVDPDVLINKLHPSHLAKLLVRVEIFEDSLRKEALHPFATISNSYEINSTNNLVLDSLNNEVQQASITPVESIQYCYEQSPTDPLIKHELLLEKDSFSNPTLSATIYYPRRHNSSTGKVKVIENSYANLAEDNQFNNYRIGIPVSNKTYELHGILFDKRVISRNQLISTFKNSSVIHYHNAPSNGLEKRLIQESLFYYWEDSLQSVAPLHKATYKALLYRKSDLALSTSLNNALYNIPNNSSISEVDLLTYGQYIKRFDKFWTGSDTITYNPSEFYLPCKINHFNNGNTKIRYDEYSLNQQLTINAVGLAKEIKYDYRHLKPSCVIDENGNCEHYEFDSFGNIQGVYHSERCSLTSQSAPIRQYKTNVNCWANNRTPVHQITTLKVSENESTSETKIIYYNGFGKVTQEKFQAEDGEAFVRNSKNELVTDSANNPIYQHTSSRWRTKPGYQRNNKGQITGIAPCFFSNTPLYESDKRQITHKVNTQKYDALGRIIETQYADGTFSKQHLTPWSIHIFDKYATCLHSNWFNERIPFEDVPTTEPHDAEERAAWLSLQYFNTPKTLLLNEQSFVVQSIDDKGIYSSKNDTTDHQLSSIRWKIDIEGKIVETKVKEKTTYYFYSMLSFKNEYCKKVTSNGLIEHRSINKNGLVYKTWNSNNTNHRYLYDQIGRITHHWKRIDGQNEELIKYVVYGDSISARNINGTNLNNLAIRTFDSSGITLILEADPRGNILRKSKIRSEENESIDWKFITQCSSVEEMDVLSRTLFESETLTTITSFNLQNNPDSITKQDGSIKKFTYHPFGLLNSIGYQLPNEAELHAIVSQTMYNASFDPLSVVYGNSASIDYEYNQLNGKVLAINTWKHTSINRKNDSQECTSRIEYTYDIMGNIVEESKLSFHSEDDFGKVVSNSTYTYDRDSKLLSGINSTHPFETKSIVSSSTYQNSDSTSSNSNHKIVYTYDTTGNIISLSPNYTNNTIDWNIESIIIQPTTHIDLSGNKHRQTFGSQHSF